MAEPRSGKDGSVQIDDEEVCDVVGWQSNEIDDLKPYASSKTGGRMRRANGIKDWNATVDILLQDGKPVSDASTTPKLEVGQAVVAKLITFDGNGYVGPGKIANIGTTTDIRGGEILQSGVEIQGDGALVPIT